MKIRRILVLVLVTTMLFCLSTPVFAAEERGSTAYGATLTLYASQGHLFLAFTNLTNTPITIGVYSVASLQTITIGTFQADDSVTQLNNGLNRGIEHNGIWYNLERYYVATKGAYEDSVALVHNIELTALDTVVANMNSVILAANMDNYVYSSQNCIHFALAVWDAAGGVDINYTFNSSQTQATNYSRFVNTVKYLYGYNANPTVSSLGSGSYTVGYRSTNGSFYAASQFN